MTQFQLRDLMGHDATFFEVEGAGEHIGEFHDDLVSKPYCHGEIRTIYGEIAAMPLLPVGSLGVNE